MKKRYRIILLFCFIVFMCITSCFIAKKIGLDDLTTFKSILNENAFGALIYVILLTFQVVFIPINSLVLIVPAILTFGAIKAFLLSLIALILGSITAYGLGKFFGNKILHFFTSGESANKWQKVLSQNAKFVLPLFLLVPIFPDELICLIAGIVKINFWYFLVVSIITRIIDLTCICFIGAVIPMHDWWLLLWGFLILVSFILAYIIGKNQEKLQNTIIKITSKKSKHNSSNL